MSELGKGGFNPTLSKFKKVNNKFKKSNKRNYDFLVRAGEKFKDAVFRLSRCMLVKEEFPRVFDNTNLHQIYRGKGRKELVDNSRYIQSKNLFPRLVDGIGKETICAAGV